MSTVGLRGSLIAFASVIGLALLTNPALAQHGGGGHSSGGRRGGFHGGGGGGFHMGGGRGLSWRRRKLPWWRILWRRSRDSWWRLRWRRAVSWRRKSLPRQRVGNSPQCWLVRRGVVGRSVVECLGRPQRWAGAFVRQRR